MGQREAQIQLEANGRCGANLNSMEILFDPADGMGSNSLVSTAGCQLLLLRSQGLLMDGSAVD
jgi:hypothetical protein